MPRATAAYLFEFKVAEFAGRLSAALTGGNRPFLIVFGEGGAARTVTFEPPATPWLDLCRELERVGRPYLFYDPFDAPEPFYLSWHRVERATMERLVGRPFEEPDFAPGRVGMPPTR